MASASGGRRRRRGLGVVRCAERELLREWSRRGAEAGGERWLAVVRERERGEGYKLPADEGSNAKMQRGER